jgi:hypothetical protein
MSILPIVKWCTNKNAMALYTRRNLIKHSTVFSLVGKSGVAKSPTEYVEDLLGNFMHTCNKPTCRIHGREVIATVDMAPGDELTYDPEQTKCGP